MCRGDEGGGDGYVDAYKNPKFNYYLTESLVVDGREQCFSFCMWNKNSY